jgi:AraC family transcriptional regulator
MDKDSALRLTRTDYERRVWLAMNHISRNIERELSLEEIAASAAFSPFHFHRIFKAVAGENVAEFTRRLRLELAANRLNAHPREDITSIALSCGFSSSQNFAKAFRQRYGMSPSEFRATAVLAEGAPEADAPGAAADGARAGNASSPPARPPSSEAAVEVVIRDMPVARAATIRRIGAYSETCPTAFAELLAWAAGLDGPGSGRGPGPGSLMALYWDNPEVTTEDRCRFDCCLLAPDGLFPDGFLPSGPVFFQEVGGGPWAFCRFEVRGEEIRDAWGRAFRWLVESGFECRPIPCCEIYYNDARHHPKGLWIIDIAIPLKAE